MCLTMGVGTIYDCREVVLMFTGEGTDKMKRKLDVTSVCNPGKSRAHCLERTIEAGVSHMFPVGNFHSA